MAVTPEVEIKITVPPNNGLYSAKTPAPRLTRSQDSVQQMEARRLNLTGLIC